MQDNQYYCKEIMSSIFTIADLLIKKDLPFAYYCLPGESESKIVFQKNYDLKRVDILNIEDTSGFVIADFNSAKTGEAYIINPDFLLSENDDIETAKKFLNSLSDKDNYHFSENISVSKSDYLDRATYLTNKLKDGELQKVVLSRVVQKDLKKILNTSKLLNNLVNKYKDAFVYLFHLPEEGTWIGASPETLYKSVDNSIYTTALAGTRLASENNGDPVWSLKEKEEQHFVTLFIESLLSELSISSYEKQGPVNIIAGNLAHLETTFKITESAVKLKIGKLIAGLHPTPAVCGLPKAEAYLLIQKAEQHQRRYYTGFLGPWNIAKESQLFVNLRCAELDRNKINIYVGGGLTASSNPEAEFQETVHKSQTLLSVVENL